MPRNDLSISERLIELMKVFSDAMNGKRSTAAEKALNEATGKLPYTMNIANIVDGQSVKHMESGDEEAHFLQQEAQVLGAQHNRPLKALDIGTFTGRSALALAQGMEYGNGGTVVTCERDPKDIADPVERKKVSDYLDIAKKHWQQAEFWPPAGHAPRIDLRLGSAKDTMHDLLAKGEAGTFDIVFIDADKPGYAEYYEQAKKLVRPGGLILLDNMQWSGRVADNTVHDPSTDALRGLNEKIAADKEVYSVLLNIGDGIVRAQKLDPERFARLDEKSARTSAAR